MRCGRGPFATALVAVSLLSLAYGAAISIPGTTKPASEAAVRAASSIGGPPQRSPEAAVHAAYGKLPLRFEENRGQSDRDVRYLARGAGYALSLTSTEAVLSLTGREGRTQPGSKGPTAYPIQPPRGVDDVVRMRLVDASRRSVVDGQLKLPGATNYLVGGDPRQWKTNIPSYEKVRYQEVYPGTDLVFYGRNDGRLEYDFVLAPGASAKKIGLSFNGARSLSLDRRGDLIIKIAGGRIRQQKPFVYQNRGGRRRAIRGRYVLEGKDRVGFRVGAYDRTRRLVIDPTLTYSTYLGGNNGEQGRDIAVDPAGNAYVTGETAGSFTATGNAFQPTFGGGGRRTGDAFVTKFNPSGGFVYSTYLGGSFEDQGEGIAADASGNAYVTGNTTSINFPTRNAAQPVGGGGPGGLFAPENLDAFVTKLNPSGSALVYSTYLGGTLATQRAGGGVGLDVGNGIAVDPSGNAYVTGRTTSSNFPTANPMKGTNTDEDAFVTKLSSTGTFTYSTFLGGSDGEEAHDIAVDSSGKAYVTGVTTSTNFPTANAVQGTNASGSSLGSDAFVTQLNPSGSALAYSTYLGGSEDDRGLGIAADNSGNAYVTGNTRSTNFPIVNPLQGTNGRGSQPFDAFVTKLNPSGSALAYSTYLGGAEFDVGSAIAVDSSGSAYVAGTTESPNFPTANPVQATCRNCAGGNPDAFVTQLDPSGSAVTYSTYLGGSDYEAGAGIAVDSSGSAYVAGTTQSPDFPTANAVQATLGGGASSTVFLDAFVTKLTGLLANLSIVKIDSPDPVEVGQPLTYTLRIQNVGPDPAQAVNVRDELPAGVDFVSASAGCSESARVVTCALSDLSSGASVQRQIVVRPTQANASLSNTASVLSATGDPQSSNNSSTETTAVTAGPPPRAPSANLSLTKTDSPDPIQVGQPLTYTLSAQNVGPDAAQAVSMRDELPAGVDFVSASAACSESARVVTCDLGVLSNGASLQRQIVVRPTQANPSLSNTASVLSSTSDPQSANNSSTETTTVTAGPPPPAPSANLSLTKADSPDPVEVGQPLTYTLSVQNVGPDPAQGVSVRDELPAGVDFVSASASCSESARVVTCTIGDLSNAASVQRQIVVRPTQANSALTNTASVLSSTSDPQSANNSSTETTRVTTPPPPPAPSANLSLTKTDSLDPVEVGQPLTYTLSVQNVGPDPAQGVSVRDELPAGVDFVSASTGCSEAARVVTCDLGVLSSGASLQRQIVVRPTQVTASLSNTASVLSSTGDPQSSNNSATETTTVTPTPPPPAPKADLSLTKAGSPNLVEVGKALTYTLTAANGGPDRAEAATMRDELQAEVEFVSASAGCSESARVVTCVLGDLSSGVAVDRQIVVRPTQANPSLSNTASVQSPAADDPQLSNNSATETTRVVEATQPPPGTSGGPSSTGSPPGTSTGTGAIPIVGGATPTGGPPAGNCGDQTRLRSSVSKRSRLTRTRILLTGRTTDRECSAQGQIIRTQRRLARVEVSIGSRSEKQCRFLTSTGTLSSPRSCRRPLWVRATTVSFDPKKSKTSWKLARALTVPRGRYNVIVRGVDRDRNVEVKKRSTNRAKLQAK